MPCGGSRPWDGFWGLYFSSQFKDVVSWHQAEVGDSPRLKLLPQRAFLQILKKKHWSTNDLHSLRLNSHENNSLEALATNIDHEAGSLETKSLQALQSNIDHETHAPLKLRASRLSD